MKKTIILVFKRGNLFSGFVFNPETNELNTDVYFMLESKFDDTDIDSYDMLSETFKNGDVLEIKRYVTLSNSFCKEIKLVDDEALLKDIKKAWGLKKDKFVSIRANEIDTQLNSNIEKANK